MINIFYSYNQSGPKKVKDNLKLGLELCGIKFAENNFIYENSIFLSDKSEMYNSKNLNKTIIGPNVWPFQNNWVLKQDYKYYITPSSWVKNMLVSKTSMLESKIHIWPTGINTELFSDMSKEEKKNDCLIYFKRRSHSELKTVIDLLKSKNQSFQMIEYGKYAEEDMISKAKISKYSFIINGTESQGIALEELMSCNIPLFVWDVNFWNDMGEQYKSPATCIPYWSSECGKAVLNKDELNIKFEDFLKNLDSYTPRNYILENLNLKKQALELIKIFEK